MAYRVAGETLSSIQDANRLSWFNGYSFLFPHHVIVAPGIQGTALIAANVPFLMPDSIGNRRELPETPGTYPLSPDRHFMAGVVDWFNEEIRRLSADLK